MTSAATQTALNMGVRFSMASQFKFNRNLSRLTFAVVCVSLQLTNKAPQMTPVHSGSLHVIGRGLCHRARSNLTGNGLSFENHSRCRAQRRVWQQVLTQRVWLEFRLRSLFYCLTQSRGLKKKKERGRTCREMGKQAGFECGGLCGLLHTQSMVAYSLCCLTHGVLLMVIVLLMVMIHGATAHRWFHLF